MAGSVGTWISHNIVHLHLACVPMSVLLASMVTALMLVALPHIWGWGTRYGITAAHEAGHAVCALVLTGRLPRVSLKHDTSGETWWRYRRESQQLVVAMAGYPAPALLGLLGAAALVSGNYQAWLYLLLGLACVETVLLVRNVFGWLVMLALVGALWALIQYDPFGSDVYVATTTVCVLVLGGLRSCYDAWRHPQAGSDIDVVHRILHLPTSMLGMGLVLVVAAMAGATLVWLAVA